MESLIAEAKKALSERKRVFILGYSGRTIVIGDPKRRLKPWRVAGAYFADVREALGLD